MPIAAYSYKLKAVVNLLDETEYAPIAAAMTELYACAKDYRETHLVLPKANYTDLEAGQKVISLCNDLTGTTLENPLSAPSLRASYYGSLCPSCDKPFRTPRAKLCAECGYQLPEGEVAGPLASR